MTNGDMYRSLKYLIGNDLIDEDSFDFEAQHDEIYVHTKRSLTQEEKIQMEAFGWTLDRDGYWMTFT